MLTLLLAWFTGDATADPGALDAYAHTLATPDPTPSPAEGYRFAGDVFADLADRAASRPGVVQIEDIGQSVWGAPIWAFHVQRPGEVPARARPGRPSMSANWS